MNIMRNLVFLVVVIGLVAFSVGCQQSGLSEGKVRDIVEEEVTRQLATMDDLTISRLWLTNDDGDILGMLGVIDNKLALTIDNADGSPVVGLGSVGEDSGGSLVLRNADGEYIVIIGSSSDGNGMLTIRDKYGQITFFAP